MSISPKIADFMKKYGVTADEIWLLPGGKSHAMLHSALERVAAEQGIEFDAPFHIRDDEHGCSLGAYGSMEGIRVWATGEATAKNCKNPYFVAMAEKRLKDRLTLKLLGIHGTGGIYSEDEADDFSEAGDRSPPGEDAIEKFVANIISHVCKNRKDAEELYEKNKGMIGQLRKAAKERVINQLRIISEKQEAA